VSDELGPIASEIYHSLEDAVQLSEASLNAIVNGPGEMTLAEFAEWGRVVKAVQDNLVLLVCHVDDLMARVAELGNGDSST